MYKKTFNYKTSKLIWLLNNIDNNEYTSFNDYIEILSQPQDLLPEIKNQNKFKSTNDVIQHFMVCFNIIIYYTHLQILLSCNIMFIYMKIG